MPVPGNGLPPTAARERQGRFHGVAAKMSKKTGAVPGYGVTVCMHRNK
jgi:hypothetical protein